VLPYCCELNAMAEWHGFKLFPALLPYASEGV
jgi:hypothetical protein